MALTVAGLMPRKKQPQTDFGERLVALRKLRGMTQVDLAKAIGATQRAISYYETEAGYPPVPAVVALAKALGVSTDELLGVKPLKAPVEPPAEERRLWRQFRQVARLPEKDQRAVLRLINSVAGQPRRSA